MARWNLIVRFKQLTLWNKIAVGGSIASMVGLIVALIFYFYPQNSTPPEPYRHIAVSQPFAENDSAFKVLILPFDPLEDCSTQESDLA